MATAQAKRNKMFYSNGKIVLENIMGEIPSYVSRDDLLTSTKTSILDKTYDSYSAVHFGPMIIQTKKEPKNIFKWFSCIHR